MTIRLKFILPLCILSLPSYAQNSELEELLSMDIQQLSTINVSSASKRDESIQDAPSVITVISAEEIRRFGGNTLADVLRRAPNAHNPTSGFATTVGGGFDFRGQSPTNVTNHVLYLLDGRPLRESQVGAWNIAIYQNFPLEAIERIEIIRGPGSVLYGTNAFSGVINIITKKAKDDQLLQTTLGYGSFGTHISEASYRKYFEEYDLEFNIAGSFSDNDGWDYSVSDGSGGLETADAFKDTQGGYLRADYKNLSISAFTGSSDSYTPGLLITTPVPGGTHKTRRSMVDLGYQQDLGKDWKANLNLTYNYFYNNIYENNVTADRNKFRDLLYEASIQGKVFDKTNVLIGGTYDERSGRLYVGNTTYDDTLIGGYFQIDTRPIDWLKLVAGAQFNKTEQAEVAKISPRLGATVRFNENYGMKLLYGEAFRNPVAAETKLNIPGISGNPDLKPETIQTTDLQFFYNSDYASFALTGYMSSSQDRISIALDPDASPNLTFLNSSGEYNYRGVEFEGKYRFNKNWDFIGSASYQYGEQDGAGVDNDTSLSPRLMLKMGATYTNLNGFEFGVFNQYMDDVLKYVTITDVRPETRVESWNYLTANMNIKLNDILPLPNNVPDTTFSLYAENLLDEEIYLPVSSGAPTQGYSGRAVFGRISMKF